MRREAKVLAARRRQKIETERERERERERQVTRVGDRQRETVIALKLQTFSSESTLLQGAVLKTAQEGRERKRIVWMN